MDGHDAAAGAKPEPVLETAGIDDSASVTVDHGGRVHIIVGNLRDISYVASNLRPDDLAECTCQMQTFDAATLAGLALRGYAFTATLDGNPEAAFGALPSRPDHSLWVAWSWGTRRMARCLPEMIAFIEQQLQPMVYRSGAWRTEARAMEGNVLAHKFLRRIGGFRRCVLPSYGMNGEDFVLYDWTRAAWEQRSKTNAIRTLRIEKRKRGARESAARPNGGAAA